MNSFGRNNTPSNHIASALSDGPSGSSDPNASLMGHRGSCRYSHRLARANVCCHSRSGESRRTTTNLQPRGLPALTSDQWQSIEEPPRLFSVVSSPSAEPSILRRYFGIASSQLILNQPPNLGPRPTGKDTKTVCWKCASSHRDHWVRHTAGSFAWSDRGWTARRFAAHINRGFANNNGTPCSNSMCLFSRF